MTHFENEKENENDLSHGYDCQVFLFLILFLESIWFRLGRVKAMKISCPATPPPATC